jgi:hypothetical protein
MGVVASAVVALVLVSSISPWDSVWIGISVWLLCLIVVSLGQIGWCLLLGGPKLRWEIVQSLLSPYHLTQLIVTCYIHLLIIHWINLHRSGANCVIGPPSSAPSPHLHAATEAISAAHGKVDDWRWGKASTMVLSGSSHRTWFQWSINELMAVFCGCELCMKKGIILAVHTLTKNQTLRSSLF